MSAPVEQLTSADDLRFSGDFEDVVRGRRELPPYWWAIPALLLVAAVSLVFINHRHASDRDAALQAQSSVSSHVAQLLTYNYKTITKELDSEQNWLTGAFRGTYVALVSKQVVPVAQNTQLVTRAMVAASGIVSSSHHHVRLLVFLDVTSQSTALSQPRITGSRVLVTADYVDGSWRISAMNPF